MIRVRHALLSAAALALTSVLSIDCAVALGLDAGDGRDAATDEAPVDAVTPADVVVPDAIVQADGRVTCPDGTKECAGSCHAVDDPAYGCTAMSCAPCTLDFVQTATCAQGACAVGACVAGRRDCDGTPANGCEVDIQSDLAHCGSCTTPCSKLYCDQGSCTDACSGKLCPPNNTCITVSGDPKNCGDCGHACPSGPASNPTCVNSLCGLDCPVQNHLDCDGVASTGCEVDITSDPANCGACHSPCPPAQQNEYLAGCVNKGCSYACTFGWADCVPGGSICDTNTQSDEGHCGGCDNNCVKLAPPNMQSAGCSGGTCQFICAPGWVTCGSGTDPCSCDGICKLGGVCLRHDGGSSGSDASCIASGTYTSDCTQCCAGICNPDGPCADSSGGISCPCN